MGEWDMNCCSRLRVVERKCFATSNLLKIFCDLVCDYVSDEKKAMWHVINRKKYWYLVWNYVSYERNAAWQVINGKKFDIRLKITCYVKKILCDK